LSQLKKYIVPIITILAIGVFFYVFTKIVIYFAISVLLALIGVPVTDILTKIKFGNRSMPRGLAALITLFGIYALLFSILLVFIPPLISELKFISELNFSELFSDLEKEFPNLNKYVGSIVSIGELKSNITQYSQNLINTQNIKLVLNNTVSIVGSLLAGLLAVSFITFFILKDKSIIFSSALLITPAEYGDEIKRVLQTSRNMMTKYFTGLLLDVILVAFLVGLSLYFFGIKNAFLIGFFAGIMNVIPYIGPLISLTFALFLGVTGCLEFNQIHEIQGVCSKIFFILLAVNILDGVIFQPYIFSSSVKAHPLEIFIVILMAATLSGVWGMVVAIPTYTLLRILAKVFLTRSKFFRKLTERIA
jgi:predicted PurR-regulated permease PerM